MRVLRRYFAVEIAGSVLLVAAGLVMLFSLFDLIHEMGDVGKGSYKLPRVIAYVFLSIPAHVYDLLPISVLIGALFALARLVASSEYTVMRASGVSATRVLRTLAGIGAVFGVLTFLCGEFVVPVAEEAAQHLRTKAITGVIAQEFRSGLWLKDEGNFVNVAQIMPDLTLVGVKVYEFDSEHRLLAIELAKSGKYESDHQWLLSDVVRTTFNANRTKVSREKEMQWHSILEPDLLNLLMVDPEKMSALRLYPYIQHLQENQQRSTRYEIALWNKAIYPVAVIVMIMLALPFSQFQQRAGNIGSKIFVGIMLGIGFHMFNKLSTFLGLLKDWSPFWSAALPTLLFFLLAIGLLYKEERK